MAATDAAFQELPPGDRFAAQGRLETGEFAAKRHATADRRGNETVESCV